ncbi:MAG: hypothetical protein JSS20_13610 [Proteobacteria bacterium]|nr:hypothetical protein [Pseudomonadota bacterium]
MPELAARDPDLARRGRFLTCDFGIGVGSMPLWVRVAGGRIESVRRGPFLLKPWTFSIRADAEAWAHFHEPFPSPGFHDLLALTKAKRAVVEGDLVPFMGNLQFVKDVIALPRLLHSKGPTS